VELLSARPFFREFAVRIPGRDRVLDEPARQGVLAGLALDPQRGTEALLVAVNEYQHKDDLENLATAIERALGGASDEQPDFRVSQAPDGSSFSGGNGGSNTGGLEGREPEAFARKAPLDLPEVPEGTVVRHYSRLSTLNHHVDKDLYPLGSCTMKYNPKVNDGLAFLPGFTNQHPAQPDDQCQGSLSC
jgi:hypothetical protein